MSKVKKGTNGTLPCKKWLDIAEATAYTNTGKVTFLKDVAPHISVSLLGKKKVYKHEDIDALIERNQILTYKN